MGTGGSELRSQVFPISTGARSPPSRYYAYPLGTAWSSQRWHSLSTHVLLLPLLEVSRREGRVSRRATQSGLSSPPHHRWSTLQPEIIPRWSLGCFITPLQLVESAEPNPWSVSKRQP